MVIEWTAEELAYLDSHYADTSMADLAAHLTRHKRNAIYNKAHARNLSRAPDYMSKVRRKAALATIEANRSREDDAEDTSRYGEKHDNARVFRIEQRPPELDRRPLRPSGRAYPTGSSLLAGE